jgi:hypothetical protein
MTDVPDKIICKGSSQKKEKILLIFVRIVENFKTLGYYCKCTKQDVFCMFILSLNYPNFEKLNFKSSNLFSKINIQQRSAEH